jgi:hypothetical protein
MDTGVLMDTGFYAEGVVQQSPGSRSAPWVMMPRKSHKPRRGFTSWQQGYGAFSISQSHVDDLMIYLANQDDHNRLESFQEEFRRLY